MIKDQSTRNRGCEFSIAMIFSVLVLILWVRTIQNTQIPATKVSNPAIARKNASARVLLAANMRPARACVEPAPAPELELESCEKRRSGLHSREPGSGSRRSAGGREREVKRRGRARERGRLGTHRILGRGTSIPSGSTQSR